jgi:olefin beta-lactone synthetase
VNVAAYLPEAARRHPERDAIVAAARGGWRRLSYALLDHDSDAVAHGMRSAGLSRGERTLVMVRAGIPLITLSYSLFKLGAVPVLIDPGMGLRAFLRCVADTEPTAFVGVPLAHALRLVFRRPFRSVRRHVTVGPRLAWSGPTLAGLMRSAAGLGAFPLADTGDDEVAAVLFTSGSTGPAKGALYTHGNFRAQVEILRETYGFRPGEVDLAAFPLFSLFDCAFGMTSVIPDLDPSRPGSCDPARVVAALREHHCTTAFGSPAIWRRVAAYCAERGDRLPELKRVLIAGASVPAPLIADLRAALPQDGDVHTPYGATEALPVATIAGREVLAETAAATRAGHGTCVGRPVSGTEVRVIRISDEEIAQWSDDLVCPPGEVGEICVKGPVVTRAYLNRDAATRAAKIRDGAAVWHRMGDLGRFDAQGRLWFAGRKAERLRRSGGAMFTDFVEGQAAAEPGVGRCALVGVGPAGAERPVLVVEGPENPALAERLLRRVAVERVLFHPRFPVDVRHNAKVHRLRLKAWAERRLGAHP